MCTRSGLKVYFGKIRFCLLCRRVEREKSCAVHRYGGKNRDITLECYQTPSLHFSKGTANGRTDTREKNIGESESEFFHFEATAAKIYMKKSFKRTNLMDLCHDKRDGGCFAWCGPLCC